MSVPYSLAALIPPFELKLPSDQLAAHPSPISAWKRNEKGVRSGLFETY